MQLEQTFALDQAPHELWPAFKDLDLLVNCLPGASADGPIDYREGVATIPLRFEVRLGPIAAVFVGTGKLTPDDETLNGSFEGSAVDRKTNSRVSGMAKFRLNAAEPSSAGTVVHVDIDYSLAGSLAQFNRAGIVRQLADALTGEFAKRLQDKIRTAQTPNKTAPVDGQMRVAAEPDPPPGVAAPPALNPLTLVWSALRQQFAKLLARLTGNKSA